MPFLEMKRIGKAFGSTRALDDVDLRVESGMVHTVLGENGSGKSTLVKTLSGVIAPDSGEIAIGGAERKLSSPRDARAAGVATVFQEVLVSPNRSVEDNVLLGLDGPFRRRVPRSERKKKAADALAQVSDAEIALHVEAGRLDLMQQHQVAVARAFAMEPRLLILDESTAALDIPARDALFRAVRRLTATGTAAVFISHRLDEVLELSDVVTVLRSGRKVANLDAAELSERRLLTLLNPEAAREGVE